jgi:acyl-homoserine lactone acylase PvdQ
MSDRLQQLKDHARRALPPREGTLKLSGLREPVEIVYDRWGVAHIFARNTYDMYFAQGYSLASERLYQADSATLDAALDELTTALGEDVDGWRWGALHNVTLTHSILAAALSRGMFGGPGADVAERDDSDVVAFFTAGYGEVGGDHNTVNNANYPAPLGYVVTSGAGVRFIVDLGDPDSAIGVTIHGQSANPMSPHWNDQVDARLTTRYHPMPFTRNAVDAAAEATLMPDPER